MASEAWAASSPFFKEKQTAAIFLQRFKNPSDIGFGNNNLHAIWLLPSGTTNEIFAIHSNGRSLAAFKYNQPVQDVQDLAIGPGPIENQSYIYIGDVGNKTFSRSTISIIRLIEPPVPTNPEDTNEYFLRIEEFLRDGVIRPEEEDPPNQLISEFEVFTLSFGSSALDCQAMALDRKTGNLLLFTHQTNETQIFSISQAALIPNTTLTLTNIATVAFTNVTAADISSDGNEILIRNENSVAAWWRNGSETIQQVLAKPPTIMDLGDLDTGGKALAIARTGESFNTLGTGNFQTLLLYERNDLGLGHPAALAVVYSLDLEEASGLVSSRLDPELLWTHNDSDQTGLFAFNRQGTVLGMPQFSKTLLDVEDIAIGPGPASSVNYLYVGDIGDNSSSRSSVQVVRVLEPSNVSTFVDETILTLHYPDQPHDAECLLVDPLSGDLFIVTKESQGFRVFRASKSSLESGSAITMSLVYTGDFDDVSGGDISPNGKQIILRREDAARVWLRKPGQSVAQAFANPDSHIPVVGPPTEPNGEAIAFDSMGRGVYTISEGSNPTLYMIPGPSPPTLSLLPNPENQAVTLIIRGDPGLRVSVVYSEDLRNWQSLTSLTLNPGDTRFLDPLVPSHRFYRLILND